MKLPVNIPRLRCFTIFWVAYMIFWMMLEGGLRATVAAAFLTVFTILGYLLKRIQSERLLSTRSWLLLVAALGAAVGLGGGVLTLVLMAIKTGLHAHGPEFSTAEVNWVLRQIPVWTAVGLLAGLGVGLLVMARDTREEQP